ncbi:MAG: sigma-54-dependent Fis family transcriptional regulator, partial [Proteobacteria bacterium]|nr:sigma-54-dependent Fis family transcriptional regulator [Pseudomonadota bacterium]
KQDIPMLVDSFLEKLSKQASGKKKTISENAMNLLIDYEWQGNVRELKNLLERLSIMVKNDRIGVADIPEPYSPKFKPVELIEEDLGQAKKQFEKQFIQQRLSLEGGDLASAAKKLGISVKYIKKSIS